MRGTFVCRDAVAHAIVCTHMPHVNDVYCGEHTCPHTHMPGAPGFCGPGLSQAKRYRPNRGQASLPQTVLPPTGLKKQRQFSKKSPAKRFF